MKRACSTTKTNEHEHISMQVPSGQFKNDYFRIKTLKIIFITALLCMVGIPSIAQNYLRNTGYITPGINMPTRDFGYPTNATNASLHTLGAGFGAGMIFYFKDDDADIGSVFNFGIDFTVAEFLVNRNVIVSPDNDEPNWFYEPTEPELTSVMMSMKVGPVVTIVPQNKIGIDIYAQGMLGLSNFQFFNTESNKIDNSPSLTPQYRVASGVRVGYHVLYVNFEYSWGEPVIRKQSTVNSGEVTSFNIDQSFFRLGLTIKFSAFK